MDLDALIEAILFFRAEPMKIGDLARQTKRTDDEVRGALDILEMKLTGRGLRLVYKDDEVMLGTAPEAGALIEEMVKEELSKDLGKAGLETLSIVLYRGPISRADIDYIRGVNSTFILRNLLVRGLVEKIPNPGDSRSFLYRPSFELLTYLGVQRVEDLPEYSEVQHEIEQFYTKHDESDPVEPGPAQEPESSDAVPMTTDLAPDENDDTNSTIDPSRNDTP